ncbi:hypothetical protein NQ318_005998 [Aromia moschata]|uniref:Fibronectin type-III domain-containing protein n=1 Tax=Aromia moschata TaxID=1265417 RepID=A0AAV8XH19_9CUCU|nr:hypothetical protein NQ318_005998 [Aromia moschata]
MYKFCILITIITCIVFSEIVYSEDGANLISLLTVPCENCVNRHLTDSGHTEATECLYAIDGNDFSINFSPSYESCVFAPGSVSSNDVKDILSTNYSADTEIPPPTLRGVTTNSTTIKLDWIWRLNSTSPKVHGNDNHSSGLLGMERLVNVSMIINGTSAAANITYYNLQPLTIYTTKFTIVHSTLGVSASATVAVFTPAED